MKLQTTNYAMNKYEHLKSGTDISVQAVVHEVRLFANKNFHAIYIYLFHRKTTN